MPKFNTYSLVTTITDSDTFLIWQSSAVKQVAETTVRNYINKLATGTAVANGTPALFTICSTAYQSCRVRYQIVRGTVAGGDYRVRAGTLDLCFSTASVGTPGDMWVSLVEGDDCGVTFTWSIVTGYVTLTVTVDASDANTALFRHVVITDL